MQYLAKLSSMVKRVMRTPFEQEAGFFLVLLVLVGGADVVRYASTGAYLYMVLVLLFHFMLSFALAFLVALMPNKALRAVLRSVIIAVAFAQACVDAFCLATGIPFNYHIAELIFATNPNEIVEFFRAYVPAKLLLLVALMPALLAYAYWRAGRHASWLAKWGG